MLVQKFRSVLPAAHYSSLQIFAAPRLISFATPRYRINSHSPLRPLRLPLLLHTLCPLFVLCATHHPLSTASAALRISVAATFIPVPIVTAISVQNVLTRIMPMVTGATHIPPRNCPTHKPANRHSRINTIFADGLLPLVCCPHLANRAQSITHTGSPAHLNFAARLRCITHWRHHFCCNPHSHKSFPCESIRRCHLPLSGVFAATIKSALRTLLPRLHSLAVSALQPRAFIQPKACL
jgi:hypothetical protein